MPLPPDDIERIDREFVRNSERDRMNERTQQIWPIFLSLSTVFGFIGLQSSEGAYLVGLFPILVSCLAQHVNDSELTLKNHRKYLYQQEKDSGSKGGAEHYFQEHPGSAKGGNKKALRRAFVVTSLLASLLVISHLQQDHASPLVIVGVACVELFSIGQTIYWLTRWKHWLTRWKRFLIWYRRQQGRLIALCRALTPDDVLRYFDPTGSGWVKVTPTKIRPFTEADVLQMGSSFRDLEGNEQEVAVGRCLCVGVEGEQWTCSQEDLLRERYPVTEPDQEGFQLYKPRTPHPVTWFDLSFPFTLKIGGETWKSQRDGGIITWNGCRGSDLEMRVEKRHVFLSTYSAMPSGEAACSGPRVSEQR